MDGDEEQSACRSGSSRGGAVAGSENAGNRVRGSVTATHLKKCADKIANHVVKKSRSPHAVDEEIPRRALGGARFPRGFVEGADAVRG